MQRWQYPSGGPEAEPVLDVGRVASIPREARGIGVPDVLNQGGDLIALDRWWFRTNQNSALLVLGLEGRLLDIVRGKA